MGKATRYRNPPRRAFNAKAGGGGKYLRQFLVRSVLCLLFSVAFPAWAGPLPDPVYFSNRMEMGDVSQAREWLNAGLSPDFMGGRIGTGMMIGAWEGNIPLMELFLSRGANINAINNKGEQALLMAAWNGKLNAVKWLVEHGAELDRPGKHWSALHYAAFNGHREVLDYLLRQGADINAQTPNGSSVLMMAIYDGQLKIAEHLLRRGADSSVRNDWGDAAFEWAMKRNHTDIARQLVSPEEFAEAASRPRSEWGEARRSAPPPPEITRLMKRRNELAAQGHSTSEIDRDLTHMRARYANVQLKQDDVVERATVTLEISARRSAPRQQRAVLVQSR